MEMSGLFLAATRDSQQWPSYAPSFLNIQLGCGEVVVACVCVRISLSRASLCSRISVDALLTEISALPTLAS